MAKGIPQLDHPGSCGAALLCIHGFPFSRAMWRAQRPLGDALPLHLFDLPGFGDSPSAAPQSLRGYSEAVLAQMDRLGLERPILCGLSMGGYIALDLQRLAPDRCGGLILCDTKAAADSDEARAARDRTIERIRRGEQRAVVEEMIPQLLSPETPQIQPQVVQQLRQMMVSTPPQSMINALMAMRDRQDATPLLPQIRCRAQIIVGSHDQLTPPAVAEAMAAKIPGAALLQIPNAGHLTPMEQPAAFNRAILEFSSHQSED